MNKQASSFVAIVAGSIAVFFLVIIGLFVLFIVGSSERVQVVNTSDEDLSVGLLLDSPEWAMEDWGDIAGVKDIKSDRARMFSIPFDAALQTSPVFFAELGEDRVYYCWTGVLDDSEVVDQYYWNDMVPANSLQDISEVISYCEDLTE